MKYRRAIFAVVYTRTSKGIEYLILKRKLHWKGWEFTKGGVKPFELKRIAARREVKEETGLKPLNVKKFNFSGKYLYNKKLPDRHGCIGQTFSLYAVEVKKGRVKLDRKEHSGYKWISFKQALRKLKWPNQKKSLRLVNRVMTSK
jgi:8-oxo-dGTP pyrophosphatase MutT (NUDIX family)